MMKPPAYLQNLIETTFNTRTKDWTRPDCGLSAAHRFSVQLGDGSKIFVKAATDAMTESWLRNEHRALSAVRGKFMPGVIAWMEEPGMHPVLVTEDLSSARWAASHAGVSWKNGDMELLMEVLREIAAIENTGDLPTIKNEEQNAWSAIAADPEAFLELKVCSASWFDRHMTTLAEAERAFDQTGNHLVHGDVRSDNICFVGSQVMLVDWSHAARGHARCDIGNLLPTLHLEGGPKPFTLMPDGAGAASFSCARLIERLNHDSDMPGWLKAVFVKLIGIELEWAASCLGLDQPDGAAWRPV